MVPAVVTAAAAVLAVATSVGARAAPAQRTATRSSQPSGRGSQPPLAPAQTIPAPMVCPSPLGVGINTKVSFCDVMTGSKPSAGIVITLPPHKGPVMLTFNLHNRHTYSEEQVKTNRAYARYTSTIGVLTMDNTLISRAVVQSEFRNAGDLLDRVGGGAGPGGVKAVAPTGTEPISIEIPESADQVSILGEKVVYERLDGSAETYSSAGRPVAVISNVKLEFHPPPPPRPVRRKAR